MHVDTTRIGHLISQSCESQQTWFNDADNELANTPTDSQDLMTLNVSPAKAEFLANPLEMTEEEIKQALCHQEKEIFNQETIARSQDSEEDRYYDERYSFPLPALFGAR